MLMEKPGCAKNRCFETAPADGGGASFRRRLTNDRELERAGEDGAWRYVDDRGVVLPVFNGEKINGAVMR